MITEILRASALPPPDHNAFDIVAGCSGECTGYADEIAVALNDAGWRVFSRITYPKTDQIGVRIVADDDIRQANALQRALEGAGIQVERIGGSDKISLEVLGNGG